jgi:hypothetical protein
MGYSAGFFTGIAPDMGQPPFGLAGQRFRKSKRHVSFYRQCGPGQFGVLPNGLKTMECGRSLLGAVTAKHVGLSIRKSIFSEPLLYRRSIFRRPRGFSGGPLDLRQRSSIPFLMSRNFTSAPAITDQAEQKHNNTLIINNFY